MLRLVGFFKILLLCAMFCLGPETMALAAPESSATFYIIDRLQVGVRRGPSTEYPINETLYTGSSVTFLSESPDKQWARIITPSGREGWILRRYLMDTPPASLLLQQASSDDNRDLTNVLETLRQEAMHSKAQTTSLEAQRRELEHKLQRLSSDCTSAVALRESHDRIQQQLNEQSETLRLLQAENDALNFISNLRWFLAGGCVLLVGLLMGWLFGRRNRRSGYSSRY